MESEQFDLSFGKRKKRSPIELKNEGFDRTRQYGQPLNCPTRYCEAGKLSTFCSPSQSCPNTPNLPNCWFDMGVRSVDVQQYIHYLNFNISCMPVCTFRSKETRMPALENVSSVGSMCQWFNTHGRCPDFQPGISH